MKTAKSNKINATQIPFAQDISAMIVPVYLSHASCPDKKNLVYAMIDSQSDTSFITDQTLDAFNVKTEEKVLNIITMNACMPVLCREVNGFKVQGYNCTETVELPPLYSRHEFPHDRSHIPTATYCNQFPHLKGIAHNLMPIQNVEVRLLLKYDVSCVHQHRDIIYSDNLSTPSLLERFWDGV